MLFCTGSQAHRHTHVSTSTLFSKYVLRCRVQRLQAWPSGLSPPPDDHPWWKSLSLGVVQLLHSEQPLYAHPLEQLWLGHTMQRDHTMQMDHTMQRGPPPIRAPSVRPPAWTASLQHPWQWSALLRSAPQPLGMPLPTCVVGVMILCACP